MLKSGDIVEFVNKQNMILIEIVKYSILLEDREISLMTFSSNRYDYKFVDDLLKNGAKVEFMDKWQIQILF